MSALFPRGAELRRIATGATWSEGPVWSPDRATVIWSDIPGDRILEVDPLDGTTVEFLTAAEFPNGRTRDLDGALVQCSHGRRAIERERDGSFEVVVDSWNGARLNSPNDVVVSTDGAIWFTDPPYGIVQPHEGHPGEREYGACYVFRFDPAGSLEPMVTDVEEPNGLAFSVDENTLYVSDTSAALRNGDGNRHIVAYQRRDERWTRTHVLFEPEDSVPDGFRVDVSDRIWTSGGKAVWVLDSDGAVQHRIEVPEVVANVCFGGPNGTTLYIAASTSIYAIETTTTDATVEARANRTGALR